MSQTAAPKITGSSETIKHIAEYAEFGKLDPQLLMEARR